MDYLNWELSVLSRAVTYTHLSAAASHVGLSQPQLSRIVARLESTLGLSLMDRQARRKSAWTGSAFRLVDAYQRAQQEFRVELERIVEGGELKQIRMGTLEGLVPLTIQLCRHLFDACGTRLIDLQVLDLNELEELFLKRSLHLVLTSREPGKKKYPHVQRLAYQTLDEVSSHRKTELLSSFEFQGRGIPKLAQPSEHQILVSNSLSARRLWFERYGGFGMLPSLPRKSRSARTTGDHIVRAHEVPVLLIAAQDLPGRYWERVREFKFDAATE